MITRVIQSLTRAFFESDLVATRVTLTFAELMWSIMLFWPGATFARPAYHYMSIIASEEVWASIFLFSAAVQAVIIVLEAYHVRFARYFALWNATLWVAVVATMLASVYPPPAAVSGEMALAFMAVWIWARPFVLLEGFRRANLGF